MSPLKSMLSNLEFFDSNLLFGIYDKCYIPPNLSAALYMSEDQKSLVFFERKNFFVMLLNKRLNREVKPGKLHNIIWTFRTTG